MQGLALNVVIKTMKRVENPKWADVGRRIREEDSDAGARMDISGNFYGTLPL